MKINIQKSAARGTVAAPPSKSMAHRLLIAAGLAKGVSHIGGVALNEDVAATIDCLRALGADCEVNGDAVTVHGADLSVAAPADTLQCRESGSTLRFFIPLALLSDTPVSFMGTEKLLSRPLTVFETLCKEQNLTFKQTADRVTVCGKLQAGNFEVAGNISSQFITGLLFALPLLENDSRICITPPIESASYIALTLQALSSFGVEAYWENATTLYVRGGQRYTATDITVEGDYSGAAFLEAFNLFGGEVQVTGLIPDSLQGDRVYREHFKALQHGNALVDISDCPDLGPILFAVAAAKHGGIFTGTKRLKIKESDRAAAMAKELTALGAAVTVEENKVTVHAAPLHAPLFPLCGHNDHRIVMAISVLLTLVGGEMEGAEAVRKSFPDFFTKISELGIGVSNYATV